MKPPSVQAVAVTAMHGIRAGRKRLPSPAAIRSIAGRFAVDDIRSDCENRLCMEGVPISGILSQLLHERTDQPNGELVDAIVIIAKLREFAFGFIVNHQPGLVADDADLGISDGGEAVCHNGHPSHAKRHGPQRSIVMERHFDTLIRILVMHVVNDVHGIDIDAREPVHHFFELGDDVVKVEVLAFRRLRRPGLSARH